jgi:hypothetical protein
MGAFALMGSTASVDTGIRNGNWHTACASSFFLLTILAQLYNTLISWIVYVNIKTINKNLLYLKSIHSFLVVLQIYISVNYGSIEFF